MSEYLAQAIRNLKPTAEFSFTDGDYSTVKWDVLEGTAPTKKQIDDEIKSIKANEVKEAEAKATARAEILNRLGLTSDEVSILLG